MICNCTFRKRNIQVRGDKYSKTCFKRPLKKKTNNWFSRLIIAKCMSKVLQNAPREHSAILSTFTKLPFIFVMYILSGCLRQVLLYEALP